MPSSATRTEILEIISTYEGLIAQCPNGEGADPYFASLDKWTAELEKLDAAAG